LNVDRMTAIAAGSNHSLAIKNDATNDGTVWAWGWNAYGQVGNGDPGGANVTSPFQIPDLSGAVAVAAGEAHSLALLSDGTVWAWGKNDFGQLGDGTKHAASEPHPGAGLERDHQDRLREQSQHGREQFRSRVGLGGQRAGAVGQPQPQVQLDPDDRFALRSEWTTSAPGSSD
jgi:alpha-tubulin suppressor-like RCC1 family protein